MMTNCLMFMITIPIVLGTTLQWEPQMEPEIHRINLDQGDEQVTDIILGSSPVVRISEMEYKRQLYSSQTLVEHSSVSIFGHNILLQQSRFDFSRRNNPPRGKPPKCNPRAVLITFIL